LNTVYANVVKKRAQDIDIHIDKSIKLRKIMGQKEIKRHLEQIKMCD